MQTISESSYPSKYGQSQFSFGGQRIRELQAIQIDIFHRITDLRDHKIYLMGILSNCIDQKNYAEDNLVKAVQQQKIKSNQFVSLQQCQHSIKKYHDLKSIELDLQQQINNKRSSNLDSALEQQIINQILEKRQENNDLQKLASSSLSSHTNFIGQLNQLRKLLEQITIDVNNMELLKQQSQLNHKEQKSVKISLQQMLKFIEEEEENKRLLYLQLVEFQKQMEQLRSENDMINQKMGQKL